MLILLVEAMVVYFIVLWAHSLRHRFGSIHFFALIGAITAVMSWVTDAGVAIEFLGMTFMVGSTVFYTSLLLGVFVVYVFDGPRATRNAISTIVIVSVFMPIIASILQWQTELAGTPALSFIPIPSLRINTASVITTIFDFIFLAVAWEILGKPNFNLKLLTRAFLTLLGVMWLDVFLFSTGAFSGTDSYLRIMSGSLLSRFFVAALAFPFLYFYLKWQRIYVGGEIENRPVLAILQQYEEVTFELNLAQEEIKRREIAEKERDEVIANLNIALSEIKTLRGLIPICAVCKKIRDDQGIWNQIEIYIREHSHAEFSHGICPDCAKTHYGIDFDKEE